MECGHAPKEAKKDTGVKDVDSLTLHRFFIIKSLIEECRDATACGLLYDLNQTSPQQWLLLRDQLIRSVYSQKHLQRIVTILDASSRATLQESSALVPGLVFCPTRQSNLASQFLE